MTYPFLTPDTARQLVLESLKDVIALINDVIACNEGNSVSIPFSWIKPADVKTLTPLLNRCGWIVTRKPSVNVGALKYDFWTFIVNCAEPCGGAGTTVFLTATQARAIRDERLKKLFDFLQTMIRQNAGEAFSIPVSEARISDLEFLKPSLKSANWSFRLITHNKSGGNTWLFEPVTEVHSVNEVKEVEVVKGSTAGWGSVWAEGSR